MEVEAGAEVAAAGGEEDSAHGGIGAKAAEGLADRFEHLPVHGVEPLLARKLDMSDASLATNQDSS